MGGSSLCSLVEGVCSHVWRTKSQQQAPLAHVGVWGHWLWGQLLKGQKDLCPRCVWRLSLKVQIQAISIICRMASVGKSVLSALLLASQPAEEEGTDGTSPGFHAFDSMWV